MNDINWSVQGLRDLLQSRELSAEEVTAAYLGQIDRTEPEIGAFVTRTGESALAAAREVDRRRQAGEELPELAGIPMALKDNISTRGVATTCSSRMLAEYVPPYDAAVVERLSAQQTILLGKLNLDEFAMGSSTETSWFHTTRNPWDPQRVPGGSSGGPAACVAARQAPFSLASDTGGSIRNPAAFCGLVGLKPTYGRVSRYGLLAFASSLDQIGPLTLDIPDCALVLEAISGYDPRDSTSADLPVPRYRDALDGGVRGMRIGVPREYFGQGLSPAVAEKVRAAAETFASLGAEVDECSMPHTEYALAVYYILAPAECSSNLARFDGVRYGYRSPDSPDTLSMFLNSRAEGFGHEVKKRIMLGTYALSAGYYDAYYRKALQVRTLIKQDFDQAFERFDVLLTPTTISTAFGIGENIGDQMAMYLSDVCTATINLAGVPALSMNCGFEDGLPVGMQLVGRPFEEATILQAGRAFEQVTDFHARRPLLAGGEVTP